MVITKYIELRGKKKREEKERTEGKKINTKSRQAWARLAGDGSPIVPAGQGCFATCP